MVTGILFAVLTGVSWIWIGVVISHAARNKLNIPYIQLFQALIGISVSALLLCLLSNPPEISARTKWITAVSMFGNGFLNYFMFLAMGAAMKRGPNGVIWSVVQAGLIFPFLMGIVFFQVAPTPSRITGILLIVISVLLFGLGKEQKEEQHPRRKTWFLFAIGAMLLCGINQCCGNLPSYLANGERIGSVYRAFFSQTGVLAAWTLGAVASGTLLPPRFGKGEFRKIILFALSLNAVGLAASYLLFYNALDFLAKADSGSLGYPLVVSSCIVGFFLYSTIFLREKTGILQKTGFLLGVAGILIICL